MTHRLGKPIFVSWKDLLKPGHSRAYFSLKPLPAFQATSSAYDPRNAWWLAELSRLIYRQNPDESGRASDGPSRNEYMLPVGLREVRFFKTPHVQCALVLSTAARSQSFAVLIFRGTVGTLDAWLPNFYSLPMPWSDDPTQGLVHKGFRRCLEEIWPDLNPVLAKLRRPIFYTGHSLGGALATMTAARRPATAVYTFGAPRIGDRNFVDHLGHQPIYRVYTAHDIVVSMPPTVGEVEFLPVGVPQALPDPKPTLGFRGRIGDSISDRIVRRFRRTAFGDRPPAFLGDHAPMKYVRHLAQWVSPPQQG